MDKNTPFFFSLLFDREGLYHALYAPTQEELKAQVAKQTVKSLVAATLPCPGKWVNVIGLVLPDLTLPDDWKSEVAHLDHYQEI